MMRSSTTLRSRGCLETAGGRRRLRCRWLLVGIHLLLMPTVGACTTHMPENGTLPAERQAELVEGWWRIGGTGTEIVIRSCEQGKRDDLCGRLVAFDGNLDQRDYANPDWLAWGRRLCGAVIISALRREEAEGVYSGRLYDPDSGDTLQLELRLHDSSEIQAKSFYGADIEEAADLGISALLGGVPSVYDVAWLLTRAVAGEEALNETQTWTRVDGVSGSCVSAS